MKTVLIAGTNTLIFNVAQMLNPRQMKLVGFACTDQRLWNVLDGEGKLREQIEDLPVMPIDMAAGYDPDVIVVATLDEHETNALKYMLYRSGFQNEVIFLQEISDQFSSKSAILRRLVYRLDGLGVPGSAAELGCCRGDVAWQMNALMPTRQLYLFDTFQGFDPRDIEKEREHGGSQAKAGEQAFSDTDKLMGRMPNPDKVVLCPGWFPQTAEALEQESFALVHVDACLYQPTLTALQFFYPRLSRGGVLLLSGYEDPRYPGVQEAVREAEEKYGAFLLLPTGDVTDTALIVHP